MKIIRSISVVAIVVGLVSCGADDDDDDSGQADADAGATADAGNLPPGSYLTSCRNCSVEQNMLSCECQADDGHWQNTSRTPATCDEGFANCNGYLTCGACI